MHNTDRHDALAIPAAPGDAARSLDRGLAALGVTTAGDVDESDVIDRLTELMHVCRAAAIHYPGVARMAWINFVAELYWSSPISDPLEPAALEHEQACDPR